MPIESIIVSVLVVAMFATFGVVLAYGEYQTRHFKRADEEAPARAAEDRWLKAA